jgi:hypothetical protein
VPSRILKPFLLAALAIGAAVLYGPGAAAAELPEQTSQANGVSVSVKPTDVSPAAKTWSFQVALNTHTGDLSDDLTRTARLVDGAGKEQTAVGWEGAPAGGHHRSGVLKFKALSPRPEALELRMVRPGETAPRTFRWTLK